MPGSTTDTSGSGNEVRSGTASGASVRTTYESVVLSQSASTPFSHSCSGDFTGFLHSVPWSSSTRSSSLRIPASTMRMTSSAVSGRTEAWSSAWTIVAIVAISPDQPDLEEVAVAADDRLAGAAHQPEDARDVALRLGVRRHAPAVLHRLGAGV